MTLEISMQVSANELRSGGSVIWVGKDLDTILIHLQRGKSCKLTLIDASYSLITSRLNGIVARSHDPQSPSSGSQPMDTSLDNLHHFTAPTLPHLLALITHQSSSFPSEASLLVVDSMSTLFSLAFPKNADSVDPKQTPVKKSEAAQWASGRRWAVMGDVVSNIGKLAATKNIAVLLTSQTTTRIRVDTGAILHPAISGTAWDTGIGTRIVLFRDWMFSTASTSSSHGGYVPGVRFAKVIKAKGVAHEGAGRISTFSIDKASSSCGCGSIPNWTRTVFKSCRWILRILKGPHLPSCKPHQPSVSEKRSPTANPKTKQPLIRSLGGLAMTRRSTRTSCLGEDS